ncbi:MAG: hypothetical protein Tsb0014_01350 [Pleurocapsa sp.]
MTEITKEAMRNRLGNIAQLQELLFGEQMKQYELKFQQCDRRLDKLEADLKQMQLNMEESLTQLETSLTQNLDSAVDSLEKKLKYFSYSTQEEIKKTKQEISNQAKINYEHINTLQSSVNSQTNNLKTEIIHTKETLEQDVQLLKKQIYEYLESKLAELSEEKMSRNDLAEILFEMCIKVKKTDLAHNLSEAAIENHQTGKTNFMLPEEKAIKST